MKYSYSIKRFSCKATAILAATFFIFSGISIPTSFANVNELTLNEAQQLVPTLTLDQANAQAPTTQAAIPSGAAVQNSNPLSLGRDSQTAGDPAPEGAIHIYEGESIQAAIDQAQAGDTVYVHAGTYHESISLKQGVDLIGENEETTIIHGDYVSGASVIQALGNNTIEHLTITGARDGQGQIAAGVRIEGDHVIVRNNKILFNLGAGVYVHGDVANILIEKNFFRENAIAVKEPKNNNVVRYNTITGYETKPKVTRISGIRYVPGQGFRLEIQNPQGAFSYRVEYSNDYGQTWLRSQVQDPPGVFKNECVLASTTGRTVWLDDGSTTSPGPLDVNIRWYRVIMTESFASQLGIEILDGQAPSVLNNIIAHQTVQSIWEEIATPLAGAAVVEGNVLFHNEEAGDASGQHLPPAISPRSGIGWTGGNVLADPQFVDSLNGDYSVPENSPAFGRGALLPAVLITALDRASSVRERSGATYVVEEIRTGANLTGWRFTYSEGSVETFYVDGTKQLDATPPVIVILSAATPANQPAFQLIYTVDGVQKTETRNLTEGTNVLTVSAVDIFGNLAEAATKVTVDAATGTICTYYNDSTNYLSSKTLASPDSSGMIFYHYLDENWQSQGYGRVDQSQRQIALNGELSYTHRYYQDSTGRLYSKVGVATGTTCTYYNNSTNYLSSITLTSPDASGMIYYHYLDENWNSQDYGRVDKQIRSDGTVLIPGSQVTGFMQGSTLIILGVVGDDDIEISENVSSVVIGTSTGNLIFTGTISEINVYGFDGDNIINAAFSVLVPVKMYAGSGDDQLFANNAAGNVLNAGLGDDLLVAINGYGNTLVGGDGLDSFWCNTSDVIQDLSASEIGDNTVHRVSEFYQPFTTDPTNSYYIPLTLAGQNLPDPTDSGITINVNSHSLFNDGMAYYNDIAQGSVGDCFFLAGLASFASTQPDVILQSIASLGDGTYGVRFYRNGVEDYLRIDGDIPWYGYGDYTKYARYGSGGDTWAMLLEKAYALFRFPGENAYDSLWGGALDEPFAILTGLGYTNLYTSSNGSGVSDDDFYNFLQTQLSSGHAVTLLGNSAAPATIIPIHVYSLQSVETVNGAMYATVYNPWGIDGVNYDSAPYDGLLTLAISELQQDFFFASACLIVTGVQSNTPYSQLTLENVTLDVLYMPAVDRTQSMPIQTALPAKIVPQIAPLLAPPASVLSTKKPLKLRGSGLGAAQIRNRPQKVEKGDSSVMPKATIMLPSDSKRSSVKTRKKSPAKERLPFRTETPERKMVSELAPESLVLKNVCGGPFAGTAFCMLGADRITKQD